MKRIVLFCRRAQTKSPQTRTLALPANWNLADLFAALLAVYPDLIDCTEFVFADSAHGRSCGGSLLSDDAKIWSKGMDLDWPIENVFFQAGSALACRCSCDWEGVSAVFSISCLLTDDGDGPECLDAVGPKSGPFKPNRRQIATELVAIHNVHNNPNSAIRDDGGAEEMEDDENSFPSFSRKELLWRSPDLPPPPPPAEPLALDDSPADPALHRRACELARRVLDLAPWESLEEDATVLLRLPDGRERVLSVLGNLGEYLALAFYPDLATFEAIHSIGPDHSPFGPNHLHAFWQWHVTFLKTPELLPGEAAAVKASGLKFPRGRLPSFEAMAPGFVPHPAGGRELADLVALLESSVALFSDSAAMGALAADRPAPGKTHLWTRRDGASWGLVPETRPCELRFPFDLPPDLLARLRALPVEDRLLSFGEMFMPIGKKSQRRFLHPVVLAVDETRGFAIPPVFGKTDETAPPLFRPADYLALVARTLLRAPHPCFPSRLASPSDFMAFFLRRLVDLRGDGVRFAPQAPCPNLMDFAESLGVALDR
jgi:hypothetical protein